jgi:hypothetical protein
MSYTADPRVLFAAERTLLAWQRSALPGFCPALYGRINRETPDGNRGLTIITDAGS